MTVSCISNSKNSWLTTSQRLYTLLAEIEQGPRGRAPLLVIMSPRVFFRHRWYQKFDGRENIESEKLFLALFQSWMKLEFLSL
jgi:hypothetical protein